MEIFEIIEMPEIVYIAKTGELSDIRRIYKQVEMSDIDIEMSDI